MIEFDEKTNWDAVKALDVEEVKKQLLNEEFNSYFDKGGNKQKLLDLILKHTGIQFKEITLNVGKKNRMSLTTEQVRPEMGVVGRWIKLFEFSLYSSEPGTIGDRVFLSFQPALQYEIFDGGHNGFNTGTWFFFDCQENRWFVTVR